MLNRRNESFFAVNTSCLDQVDQSTSLCQTYFPEPATPDRRAPPSCHENPDGTIRILAQESLSQYVQAHLRLAPRKRDAATPGRRRGAAVHFTMTQGGGEGHRSGCAVPATPGRRRGAAGLAIIDPGRRRGPMHSLRSVLPGSGDKVRRHQGGGEMPSLFSTGPGRRRGPSEL